MIIPHPDNLAFYDFDAVEPDSFPFKLGWAIIRHDERTVLSTNYLIEPSVQWNIEKTWSEGAQTAHGISLARLKRHGMKPSAICENMNRRLADREVFACNASGNGWLQLLFDMTNVEPDFTLRQISVELLISNLANERRLTDAERDAYKSNALDADVRLRPGEPTAQYYATIFSRMWRSK